MSAELSYERLQGACQLLGRTLVAEIRTQQAAWIAEQQEPGAGMQWITDSLLDAGGTPDDLMDDPDDNWDGVESALDWYARMVEKDRELTRLPESDPPPPPGPGEYAAECCASGSCEVCQPHRYREAAPSRSVEAPDGDKVASRVVTDTPDASTGVTGARGGEG